MHPDNGEGRYLNQIGNAAGEIWNYLQANGPVTVNKLMKEVSPSRDLVMQGVGWLAREGKIKFEQRARARLISLQ